LQVPVHSPTRPDLYVGAEIVKAILDGRADQAEEILEQRVTKGLAHLWALDVHLEHLLDTVEEMPERARKVLRAQMGADPSKRDGRRTSMSYEDHDDELAAAFAAPRRGGWNRFISDEAWLDRSFDFVAMLLSSHLGWL
jgi:hypothetical protein